MSANDAADPRQDGATRQRLDDIQEAFRSWAKLTAIILSVLVLVEVVVGVVSIVLWERTRDNADRIQQNRVSIAANSCRDQNQRHDNTLVALNQVLQQARKSEGISSQQAQQSQSQTTLLINALAPHQNCQTVVAAVQAAGQ
jgi:hypothetical protein